MPCFGSKRAEVVPSTTADGPAGKGAGRLESEGKPGSPAPRDGLHSAPTSQDREAQETRRQGLHSAPQATPPLKTGAEQKQGSLPAEPIGDFIIEASDGNQPTAAAVDAYLEDIVGAKIVKVLRGAEWADRVAGIEQLQQLVKRSADEGAVATGEGADVGHDESERSALFRACVTVLSRVLQDKVVPVYLPALSLLAEVYSPQFLSPIRHGKLPKTAIGHFANQLVFRAGSSNVRAREESSAALLALARCDAVGCAAVAPFALRPLSNTKSAHAAVGRLELLRTLVAEFGLGENGSGLQLRDVLVFTLPLCESAAEKSRDAALGLVLDVRGSDAKEVKEAERLVEELRPSVLATLKARLAPPDAGKANASNLGVVGKRLPPLPSIGSQPGSMPGAMPLDGEVVAVQGTPPNADSRARARSTATELGARHAPPNKKKPSKRNVTASDGAPPTRVRRDSNDTNGLLAEASSLLGGEVDISEPKPVRLAAGNAGYSPSKHTRGGRGVAPVGIADAEDEVTNFMTDDQLMESILEATK